MTAAQFFGSSVAKIYSETKMQQQAVKLTCYDILVRYIMKYGRLSAL